MWLRWAHGVGWLFFCVDVGLLACRGTWFSCSLSQILSLMKPLVVSLQRTTCIYVGAASRLPLVVCFIQKLIQDGIIVHNSAQVQFRYPTMGPKLYHEYLFESVTDQFLSDRHVGSKWFSFSPSYALASAHTFKLFLLVSMVYELCDPINVSYLLHCCLYPSLELLSKEGCAQC